MKSNVTVILFLSIFIVAVVSASDLYAQSGDIGKRRAFFWPENRAMKFQTAEEAFPSRLVRATNVVWELKRAKLRTPFSSSYAWMGDTYTMEQFFKRTHTTALLILKNDEIIVERYFEGSSNTTRFFSFSSAKSITSTLVGMAIEDGFINNLGDPLTKYLPSLVGSAYENVSIKDALQMLTGVSDREPDEEWKDKTVTFVKCHQDSIVEHRYRFVEGANGQTRDCPPGTKFNYSSMTTAILGWLVETTTRKRLSTYMEERLWIPAGMEADAVWFLDGPPEIGREMAAGNFAATLKDYGRFGLLALHQGEANGRRILNKEWFRSATIPDRQAVQIGTLWPGSQVGYGFQWWIRENNTFLAEGVYGQFISINPKANVVIVKLSAWPKMIDETLEMECFAFFDAVAKALE